MVKVYKLVGLLGTAIVFEIMPYLGLHHVHTEPKGAKTFKPSLRLVISNRPTCDTVKFYELKVLQIFR